MNLDDLVTSFGHLYKLSPREIAVLHGAARGVASKAVAAEIGCSSKTVEEYWRRMYRKTRRSSRLEIIALLLELAVLSP